MKPCAAALLPLRTQLRLVAAASPAAAPTCRPPISGPAVTWRSIWPLSHPGGCQLHALTPAAMAPAGPGSRRPASRPARPPGRLGRPMGLLRGRLQLWGAAALARGALLQARRKRPAGAPGLPRWRPMPLQRLAARAVRLRRAPMVRCGVRSLPCRGSGRRSCASRPRRRRSCARWAGRSARTRPKARPHTLSLRQKLSCANYFVSCKACLHNVGQTCLALASAALGMTACVLCLAGRQQLPLCGHCRIQGDHERV